jgi:adenylate kinase family enzyme
MLREEVEAGTLLGKQVESIMKSGGLVSSAIMVALMQKKMKGEEMFGDVCFYMNQSSGG